MSKSGHVCAYVLSLTHTQRHRIHTHNYTKKYVWRIYMSATTYSGVTRCTNTNTHTHTHKHTLSLFLSLTHTRRTNRPALSLSLSFSLSPSLSFSLCISLTHSLCPLSLLHTHTHVPATGTFHTYGRGYMYLCTYAG